MSDSRAPRYDDPVPDQDAGKAGNPRLMWTSFVGVLIIGTVAIAAAELALAVQDHGINQSALDAVQSAQSIAKNASDTADNVSTQDPQALFRHLTRSRYCNTATPS
jgi:hypothetical protein